MVAVSIATLVAAAAAAQLVVVVARQQKHLQYLYSVPT